MNTLILLYSLTMNTSARRIQLNLLEIMHTYKNVKVLSSMHLFYPITDNTL